MISHGKAIVTGVGKTGDVGRKIISTLLSIGEYLLQEYYQRHHLGYLGKKAKRFV